ncbi:Pepco domain-containing protein [Nostoc sp.]|uniref:Pepco domain-containing protein n=1 Tax=Nostoc sp. TaxID=1180 RepID=UPI002FF21D64
MSAEIPTPKMMWIITEETEAATSHEAVTRGSRGSFDIGGRLGAEITETTELVITRRKAVEVGKLKQEMKGFLQAMREILEEADEPDSKIQLDEVELSVEITGEGQISLLGIGGGKAGAKGAMTFKFKRK